MKDVWKSALVCSGIVMARAIDAAGDNNLAGSAALFAIFLVMNISGWVKVEERDDEITKLRGLLRALVDEIDYTGRRFCQRCPESNCDQTEPLQECAYHAAKAALRGEG